MCKGRSEETKVEFYQLLGKNTMYSYIVTMMVELLCGNYFKQGQGQLVRVVLMVLNTGQ